MGITLMQELDNVCLRVKRLDSENLELEHEVDVWKAAVKERDAEIKSVNEEVMKVIDNEFDKAAHSSTPLGSLIHDVKEGVKSRLEAIEPSESPADCYGKLDNLLGILFSKCPTQAPGDQGARAALKAAKEGVDLIRRNPMRKRNFPHNLDMLQEYQKKLAEITPDEEARSLKEINRSQELIIQGLKAKPTRGMSKELMLELVNRARKEAMKAAAKDGNRFREYGIDLLWDKMEKILDVN